MIPNTGTYLHAKMSSSTCGVITLSRGDVFFFFSLLHPVVTVCLGGSNWRRAAGASSSDLITPIKSVAFSENSPSCKK